MTPITTAGPVSFTVSHDRDWTWIKFDCKPDEITLSSLRKIARFSWRREAWYSTRHLEGSEVAALLNQDVAVEISARETVNA